MRYVAFGLAALAITQSPALAQESCTKIGHPIERLECYDEWASGEYGRPVGTVEVKKKLAENGIPSLSVKAEATAGAKPAAPADDATKEEPKARWLVSKDKSAMTDTTNIFALVPSESPVMCKQYGNGSTPLSLWLRCMENTTSVIIGGDCHVASGFEGYGDVTYRLDDQKPQTRGFDASTDSSALGLWSGGNAIPFIKDMFGHDKLLVRFTPFGMSPVEATFDIRGTEAAVTDLRKECGW